MPQTISSNRFQLTLSIQQQHGLIIYSKFSGQYCRPREPPGAIDKFPKCCGGWWKWSSCSPGRVPVASPSRIALRPPFHHTFRLHRSLQFIYRNHSDVPFGCGLQVVNSAPVPTKLGPSQLNHPSLLSAARVIIECFLV